MADGHLVLRGRVLDDADVLLVEPEHLQVELVGDHSESFERRASHLLRAPLVDDLRRMLCLVSVLPVEIDNELAGLLILAGINSLHVVFPAAAGGFPRGISRSAGRCVAVGRVRAILAPLGCCRCGPSRLSAALLRSPGLFGLLDDLFATAKLAVVLLENFGGTLAVSQAG